VKRLPALLQAGGTPRAAARAGAVALPIVDSALRSHVASVLAALAVGEGVWSNGGMERLSDARAAQQAADVAPQQSAAPVSASERILALERTAGNRAVGRMLARPQARERVLGRQGTGAAAATPATLPDFMVRDVDRAITERISHAPRRFSAWNGTYGWHSKWRLRLDTRAEIGKLEVIVRLHSSASSTVKTAWENAILAKWDNKFAFCVLREVPVTIRPGVIDRFEEMYPIRIVIAWVDHASDAHYVVAANAADATEGDRAGVRGTTSMTGWGTADTQDMTHEFGHMLGCPEEYFTTDGVDFAAGGKAGYRDPGAGVMNNPAGPALARNFDVIRHEAATLRGVRANRTEVAPWS
jgi:hypothetical protein